MKRMSYQLGSVVCRPRKRGPDAWIFRYGAPLHLTLTISPTGDVTSVQATGDSHKMTLWPQVQGEVYQWKFIPFEKDGKPTIVEVEEDIYAVPPERLPATHVTPPPIRPDSKIAITLERTASLYGANAVYSVTITNTGIVYESHAFTVADGKHTDKTDPDKLSSGRISNEKRACVTWPNGRLVVQVTFRSSLKTGLSETSNCWPQIFPKTRRCGTYGINSGLPVIRELFVVSSRHDKVIYRQVTLRSDAQAG
jgi:hypothetical protein